MVILPLLCFKELPDTIIRCFNHRGKRIVLALQEFLHVGLHIIERRDAALVTCANGLRDSHDLLFVERDAFRPRAYRLSQGRCPRPNLVTELRIELCNEFLDRVDAVLDVGHREFQAERVDFRVEHWHS